MNPYSFVKIITKIFKTLSIRSTSLKSYDIIDFLKFKPIYCKILIIVKIQAKLSFSTLTYHHYVKAMIRFGQLNIRLLSS